MSRNSAPENAAVACSVVKRGSVSRRMVRCQRLILDKTAGYRTGEAEVIRCGSEVRSD